jgi:uncharacterized membrane protein
MFWFDYEEALLSFVTVTSWWNGILIMELLFFNAEIATESLLLNRIELSEERNLKCTVLFVISSFFLICSALFWSLLFSYGTLLPPLLCVILCFVTLLILFSALSVDRYCVYWNYKLELEYWYGCDVIWYGIVWRSLCYYMMEMM